MSSRENSFLLCPYAVSLPLFNNEDEDVSGGGASHTRALHTCRISVLSRGWFLSNSKGSAAKQTSVVLIAEPTTPKSRILLKVNPVTEPIQKAVQIGWCKDVNVYPSTSSTSTAKIPHEAPITMDAMMREFGIRLSSAITIHPLVENSLYALSPPSR